jgi:hypothetical protein
LTFGQVVLQIHRKAQFKLKYRIPQIRKKKETALKSLKRSFAGAIGEN